MTNEEWKICFMEATQRDLQEIMDTPYAGEEKGFSLPYRRQREKMLKDPNRWCKERLKPVWKRVMQRAACFFLVILVGLGSAMVVSPTVRAAVTSFVKRVFQDRVEYTYTAPSGNYLRPPFARYRLQELPDGYTAVRTLSDDFKWKTITYELPSRETETAIVLHYEIIQGDTLLNLHTGGRTGTDIQTESFRGTLYEFPDDPSAKKILVWKDVEEGLLFCLYAPGSTDELLAIAAGVQPDPEDTLTQLPEYYLHTVYGEMPDGYSRICRTNNITWEYVTYDACWDLRFKDGVILFGYGKAEDADAFLDLKGLQCQEVSDGDFYAKYYFSPSLPKSKRVLVWQVPALDLTFYIRGTQSVQTLMDMAECVRMRLYGTEILPDYRLTGLPENYEIEIVFNDFSDKTVIYNLPDATDGKNIIALSYGLMEEGSGLLIDAWYGTLKSTKIKDGTFSGELYEEPHHPEETKYLVWQVPEENLMFFIAGRLDVKEMVAYAKSIQIKQ